MDVLCVGLMVYDIIAKPVGRIVFDIDTSRIDSLKIASGGDALNAAIDMGKLGLKVGLAAKIGNDIMGSYLAGEAARHGVDISRLVTCDEISTSTSIVLVDESGERHFIYYGKANDSLTLEDIDDESISKASIVHVGSAMSLAGLDGRGLAELFKKAKLAGADTSMDVSWDSSGQWLGKIVEALQYTDTFMPSLREAQMISGKNDPEDIAKFFSGYGLKVLAVKLGSQGCFVTDFKDRYTIGTFDKTNVVDTTGAGDAFVSGFLAGTIRKASLYERGVLGNAVASMCISKMGATTGTRNWDETMDFIRKNTVATRV